LAPSEIRADIRAFLAASLAGEARLDVGQPDATPSGHRSPLIVIQWLHL
jgi:hypothetical protein